MHSFFTRSSLNPILHQHNTGWWKIYNPGACVDDKGAIHLFPRVIKKEKDWHSRIIHGVSHDGEHFTFDKEPALIREGTSELHGLEDPRVTYIDGTYYMLFAAYDGKTVLLHSATSSSLDGPWKRHGALFPHFDFFKNGGKMIKWEHGKPIEKHVTKRGATWNKSGALFPERINGKMVIVFGEYYMWLATSTDGIHFTPEPKPFLKPRSGTTYFDNTFIETGPPPLLTEKGWLMLYHGIDEAFRYQLGFVILDRDNPRTILYRSPTPIFGPHASYEVGDALIDVIKGGVTALQGMNDEQLKKHYAQARNENIMPQVTFCPSAVVTSDNILRIYYGAGDTSICTATVPLRKLLELVPTDI